jgi:predicted site-specific integrase-resolvase
MATVNIKEAAKLAGISRAHLYNHYINRGKISVIKNEQGKREIDTAELLRVFGKLVADTESIHTQNESIQHLTQETQAIQKELERENQHLRELVKLLEEQKKEASERETWLKSHVDGLTHSLKLIEDKREPTVAPAPKSFWHWLKS